MSANPSDSESLRRSAAIHEAGHAVVAWALDELEVQELRIGSDGKGSSVIQCAAHLPMIERVAIAAAGTQAGELL
ncbi:MAG: hypothetical protein WAK63_11920, partial [Xanthobacteraceae bacterium]